MKYSAFNMQYSVQVVGAPGEVGCQILHHLTRIGHIDDVTGNQSSQPVGGGAPPDIMPRRDGTKGARVIVEAGSVVETRCLDDLIEVASHAVQAVEKPPGRTQLQRRVMPCQRRELA